MAQAKQVPRPHAVMIPVPAQGHVNPMFKLAKLLHHRGFHITFVNTEFNHRRLLQSRGASDLEGLPTFQFTAIPDGLPPSDEDATQDPKALVFAIKTNFWAPFRALVLGLNDSASSNVPPVTCIISDAVMTFALEVAEELSIPSVLFWTPSASGVLCYAYTKKLMENGYTPLKDKSCLTNGYLDAVINWIPGIEGIRLKNLPTMFRTLDPNDVMVYFNMGATEKSPKGSAVIVNTFHDLESGVIQELLTMFPKLLTVGPLQLQENGIQGNKLDSIGTNLWKEDSSCLSWLNSKAPNSVVLVNFGSIARLTAEQLMEFAWGLANSRHNFLWVIRTDLLAGETPIFPAEFEAETKETAFFTSWCPQEKVLRHPAIGGFLTHSGWNSTLESICAGVPMLCWPAYAEQPTNAWICCNDWGIGMEIDIDVKRNQVERLVRELMSGEKGREMKSKAMQWKKKAEEACSTGSSYINFEKLVKVLLSSVQETY